MTELIKKSIAYIEETLSIKLTVKNWKGANRLPLFLGDLYQYYECTFLKTDCLLLIPKSEADLTPAKIKKHIEIISRNHDLPGIFVAPTISSFQRGRLIQQKIPFVIPGNQMYLPFLGIDLREYYKNTQTRHDKRLNPATQALLLHLLYETKTEEFSLPNLAKELGYSSMTIVRAFDELRSLEVADTWIKGRKRTIKLTMEPHEVWDHIRAYLQSPVTSRVFLQSIPAEWNARKAGLSALSAYTMISPPPVPVFSLRSTELRRLKTQASVREIPVPEAGGCVVEVWSYNPYHFGANDLVDPLSLSLTFIDSQDERIEAALEKLTEVFPW